MPTAPPRSRNYDSGQPSITPRRHLNNKEKSRGKCAGEFVRRDTFCAFRFMTEQGECVKCTFFVASRHSIHFDDTLTNEDIDSNESLSSIESKLFYQILCMSSLQLPLFNISKQYHSILLHVVLFYFFLFLNSFA